MRTALLPAVVLLLWSCKGSVNNDDLRIAATIRVSVASGGIEGLLVSQDCSISVDGRHVAFKSASPNLVPVDTNGKIDIFVHDVETRQTTLVSVNSAGAQANQDCSEPVVSGDGSAVAFRSQSTNLHSAPTTAGRDHIYLRDLKAGTTVLVSKTAAGAEANGLSVLPSISADGTLVAYMSYASDIVLPDSNGTNADAIVFRAGVPSPWSTRVNVNNALTQSALEASVPSISPDGHYVAFVTASSLAAGDVDASKSDIYLRENWDNPGIANTRLISINGAAGTEGDCSAPSVSQNGDVVAFVSFSQSLVPGKLLNTDDVFVWRRSLNSIILASKRTTGAQGNQGSALPRVSADGRTVAFHSYANNLIPDDLNEVIDVFVHYVDTGETRLVSTRTYGAQGLQDSLRSGISGDGSRVVFESDSPNLVDDDSNGTSDIFMVGPLR